LLESREAGWPRKVLSLKEIRPGGRPGISFAAVSLQLEILGEVALAMVLGAFLGLERELAHKSAGLRTHMLIAGASAMLVGLVDALLHRFLLPAISPLVRADPVPVITAVVMAVGFLGAGTIIRREDHVKGLTTAASMLFAAAVGSAVGLRQFLLAIGATILALATLRLVLSLEGRLPRGGGGSPDRSP
jgi:putative Mg2+ transporter-C (MgtC) family protein